MELSADNQKDNSHGDGYQNKKDPLKPGQTEPGLFSVCELRAAIKCFQYQTNTQ